MSGSTELLVLKIGGDYIRVQDGKCVRGGLQTASVFPTERLEAVRLQLAELRAGGSPEARLFRLSIAEEPYDLDPQPGAAEPICGQGSGG